MQNDREENIIVRYIPEYIVVETRNRSVYSEDESCSYTLTINEVTTTADNLKYDYEIEESCFDDGSFEHIEVIDRSSTDIQMDEQYNEDASDDKQTENLETRSSRTDTVIEQLTRKYNSKTSQLLNGWFFSHLHNPYPTEEEKDSFALQANMTKVQINNWFINKRKRNKHLFQAVKKTIIETESEIDQENRPYDDCMDNINDSSSTTVKLEVIIQPDPKKKRRQEDNLPQICDVCGKTFSHRYMLQSHLKRHDPSKWEKCEVCHKSFPDGLKRHMRTHSGERPFVCSECGASYTQAFALTMHKALHNDSGQLYYCDTCNNGKGYRSKYALKDHLKLHYRMRNEDSIIPQLKAALKPPKRCTICGFETYNMKSHMIARHSTLRPFKCELCSDTFKFKKDLQTHHAYHSDEMNFQCDECEKRFKTKRKLVIHKRIHSSEKLFKCTLCDKSFLVSTYLTKHMRTHTGQKKRHACTECSKDYSGITDLRRHLEREHGIRIEPNPKYSNNNMTRKYKVL